MDPVGILFAVLSAVFNGSFGTFSKLKPVQEAKVSGQHAGKAVSSAMSDAVPYYLGGACAQEGKLVGLAMRTGSTCHLQLLDMRWHCPELAAGPCSALGECFPRLTPCSKFQGLAPYAPCASHAGVHAVGTALRDLLCVLHDIYPFCNPKPGPVLGIWAVVWHRWCASHHLLTMSPLEACSASQSFITCACLAWLVRSGGASVCVGLVRSGGELHVRSEGLGGHDTPARPRSAWPDAAGGRHRGHRIERPAGLPAPRDRRRVAPREGHPPGTAAPCSC